MIRTLDITSFFSDACGGIKTYYRAKARWLPPLGVECHFAVPSQTRTVTPFAGGTLHGIPGPRLPLTDYYRCFGDVAALWRVIHELEPDLIEVGSHYLLPGLVRHGLRKLRRQPALVGFYHADFPHAYVEPALRHAPARLTRRLVALAWRLVRRQHARYLRTLAGSRYAATALTSQRVAGVRWVGLGVDCETFRPGGEPGRLPRLAFVGRLADEKGLPVLLAAWDAIHRATGAELVVAGAGPLEGVLARFAARRPSVRQLGYLDAPTEVAAVLASADAVCVPCPYESFSLVTAEALACETPVIAADQRGAAELVRASDSGLTFATGDPRGLALAAIDLLSRSPSQRRELGRRGRRHVLGSLTWPAVCQRIHAVYREVT